MERLFIAAITVGITGTILSNEHFITINSRIKKITIKYLKSICRIIVNKLHKFIQSNNCSICQTAVKCKE